MMTYKLDFDERALKEWKKLGATVREQLRKKLKERLKNPHVPASKLSGFENTYKIKLVDARYRLVYEVINKDLVVFVISVDKREKSKVYKKAAARATPQKKK